LIPAAFADGSPGGVFDAVMHLASFGEVSTQIAARHHGNPGIGAVARRPVKVTPIEASDATGLLTHDR
jgi:hypothetical protein